MAKLTGAKKKAFLERMAKGRRKAARGNPRKKTAAKKNTAAPKKKKTAKAKNGKLTGAKKKAFLERMAKGRRKAKRATASNPKRGRPKISPNSPAKRAKTFSGRPKRAKTRKRNPDGLDQAEQMFETFHQKPPGRIVEYEEMYRYPENYAELGKLIELRIYLDAANPDFPLTRFGECQTVTTPDGANIYFIGGDQRIDLDALDIASSKDFVDLGPCTYICYFTVKGFHDFEPTKYWHRFGEEDKILPTLVYDRLNKSLFLISGNYRVEHEGIVN